MRTAWTCALTVVILAVGWFALAAEDPVKWSAPMEHYPNQWSPSAAPPSFYNPYGYTYSYDPYGYGAYGGQWGGGGHYPGAPGQGRPQSSGNPYYYYRY